MADKAKKAKKAADRAPPATEDAYPLALYRPGSSFDWDGKMTDSCVVNDEDEHLQATEDGWQDVADYFAEPDAA